MTGKGISPTIITGLYVAGGVVMVGIVYFGVIKPVFEFVGIKDSKEDRLNKATVEKGSVQQYWSPSYWKSKPSRLTYAEQSYYSWAKELYQAMEGWGTDEERIYGVFRKMRTGEDLSKLADVYLLNGNQDLYQKIVDELDLEELAELQRIIDNFIK